jgi:ribosomal protein S18 acetylase RimI-like enzyme
MDIVVARGSVALDFVVRPCVEEDLPDLEWMGLYAPHREIIAKAFQAQRRGDALMLLAVASGFPVAQAWVDLARKPNRRTAVLWAVRTFPPLRGLGIGRHLMLAAEAVLRDRGIVRAELGVERDNPGARRFYERLGYHAAGPLSEVFSYVTPQGLPVEVALDEWLMVKEL